MTKAMDISQIHPIHPFPARMTPSLVWDFLPDGKSLFVLDPMAGSGTTLVSARAKGHKALGCDTDPLALLIAHAWCADIYTDKLLKRAKFVLEMAMTISEKLSLDEAYPQNCDEASKRFINFWFDEENRIQLTALARGITQVYDLDERVLLWSAFSRLIITKRIGASLAMDVSHSRPHRKYQKAPISAFNRFLQSVDYIIKKAPFRNGNSLTAPAIVGQGDAREMPFRSNSIDMIITSPPYLNAIDYLRGHKLSLVWMGHSIESLRSVQSSNIGTERSMRFEGTDELEKILRQIGEVDKLNGKHRSMIMRYINDMSIVFSECRRVLKKKGQAIFVIGNSSIRGVYISNSEALIALALKSGFILSSQSTRSLPESKRYLPPPNSEKSGREMKSRMREEVILQFVAV